MSKRRQKKGTCIKCTNYDPTGEDPCLWKLEAQLDSIDRRVSDALGLVRRMTARKRMKLTGGPSP